MPRRRTTRTCPLPAHNAGPGRRCIACGKSFKLARSNRPEKLPPVSGHTLVLSQNGYDFWQHDKNGSIMVFKGWDLVNTAYTLQSAKDAMNRRFATMKPPRPLINPASKGKDFLISSTGPDAQRIYLSPAGRWITDRLRAKRYTERDAAELAGLFAERSPGVHTVKIVKPGFVRSNPRKATLEEATAHRLAEFADLAESGITEMTGKIRRDYTPEDPWEKPGEVVGRFGGIKPAYPELMRISAGPKVIAAAIRRGKGKTFETVRGLMEHQLTKLGFEPRRKRSPGRPTVAPHKKLRPYCEHCGNMHSTNQHRFHGEGAFHRTHLFSFGNPPAPAVKPARIGRAEKIYYKRDQGNRQGPYFHKFTRTAAGVWTYPPGWAFFKNRVAVIR